MSRGSMASCVNAGMMYEKGEGSQSLIMHKLQILCSEPVKTDLLWDVGNWHDCTDKEEAFFVYLKRRWNSTNKPAMKESLKVVDNPERCLKLVKEMKEIVYER